MYLKILKNSYVSNSSSRVQSLSIITSVNSVSLLAASLDPGLVARWQFKNSLVDSVGSVSISCQSPILYVQNHLDEQNNALGPLGMNQCSVPTKPFFNFPGAFTVSVWIKCNMENPLDNQVIFDFGNGISSDSLWFGFNRGETRLSFWIFDMGSPTIMNGVTSLALNTWNFVTLTFDGTVYTLYINGVSDVSKAMSPPRNVQRSKNYIGSSISGVALSTKNTILDDFRIYNRALSQAEIRGLNQSKQNKIPFLNLISELKTNWYSVYFYLLLFLFFNRA